MSLTSAVYLCLRLRLGSATGCDSEACTPGRSCGTATCPACTKSWAAFCLAAALVNLWPTWQSWAWVDYVHTSYRCATWPTLRSTAYPALTYQRSPAGTPLKWWRRPGQWRTRVCIMRGREHTVDDQIYCSELTAVQFEVECHFFLPGVV